MTFSLAQPPVEQTATPPCESHWLTTPDGHRVRVDCVGHAAASHAVVIVLPVGVTSAPVAPLVARLARWSTVYSLHGRFVLDEDVALGPEHRIDASALASDIGTLARHFNLKRFGLLGYCVGALVALRGAAAAGDCVTAFVSCNGSFERSRRCQYERDIDDLLKVCAGRRSVARAVRSAVAGRRTTQHEFDEYTRIVLRDDETFYKYVTTLEAVFGEGLTGLDTPLEVPALLIAGDADEIASPQHSEVPRPLLRHHELRYIPGGDHYLPCRPGTPAIDEMDAFLRQHAEGGPLR